MNTLAGNNFMQLSASTYYVDCTHRRLANCTWHRKPYKCNDAPGCFHNGTKCVVGSSRFAESNYCSLYDRRRRMCRRNGCYFDESTRKCFTLTDAPTPMLTSPSQRPTNASKPKPTTSEPSESPTPAPATPKPTASPTKVFDPSLSPSTSPAIVSPTRTSIPKPTPLRSQEYCSKLHNKPRRCINRGCLFDSSTRQCTNGVPTATPTTFPSTPPSVSPSALLTESPQPTNKAYRVRLYWEQGYEWQDDPLEKFFCWACAKCKECTPLIQDRTADCVDLQCDVQRYCTEGMSIAVTDCDPTLSRDKSAAFTFLPGRSGLFDNYLKGGQIQVHNTDLCLSQTGVRYIELESCDASKIEQRFLRFASDEGAMELYPVKNTVKDGRVEEQCITNHHHPRIGERVFVEKCSRARRSDTSLWDLWTVY